MLGELPEATRPGQPQHGSFRLRGVPGQLPLGPGSLSRHWQVLAVAREAPARGNFKLNAGPGGPRAGAQCAQQAAAAADSKSDPTGSVCCVRA